MKKTVIFDLDDTISSNGNILSEIIDFIKEYKNKINLIISSARDFQSIIAVLNNAALSLDYFSHIVSEDGFYCYYVKKDITHVTGSFLDINKIDSILNKFSKNRIIVFSEKANYLVSQSSFIKLIYLTYKIIRNKNIKIININYLNNSLNIKKIKIKLTQIEKIKEILKDIQGNSFIVENTFLQIQSNTTDKYFAIRHIQNSENISDSQIFICGNDNNDLLSLKSFDNAVVIGERLHIEGRKNILYGSKKLVEKIKLFIGE
jgi:HAD superfamily hydrolase (TIGR01484 family)